jgi:hypothetical protein
MFQGAIEGRNNYYNFRGDPGGTIFKRTTKRREHECHDNDDDGNDGYR